MPVNWNIEKIGDQSGRVVIVTGSTSGIGLEAARVLVSKKATVVMAVRNIEKGKAAANEITKQFPGCSVTVCRLDLANLKSVKAFAQGILEDYHRLDVLINNAGVMMCPYALTADGFEIQMGTNHLGHFALTGHLMPLLKNTQGSRIVVLSSAGHKMGDIDLGDLNWESRKYDTNKAYYDSKLANLLFTYELARRLAGNGNHPLVTAAHPGWTRTELQRHSGLFSFFNNFFSQEVGMGCLPTLRAGFDKQVQPGGYYGPGGFLEMRGHPVIVKSNKRSHDKTAARKLWELSEELTGVKF